MAKLRSIPAAWRKLFKLIPGYDPVGTAAPGEWFDAESAQKACAFFPACLQHIEGTFAGSPFELGDWQRAIVGSLFGWKRADGSRRFREALIGVGRGNGKTPLAAGICLYMLFCDGEPGAQIYGAAADVPQAGLLYRHAVGMIHREPELDSRCEVRDSLRSVSLRSDPASVYRVVSSDAGGKHGYTPHLVIADELHAWEGRLLMEAFETGFAKAGRRQPLLLHITTRDFDRPSVCNEKWDYAQKVRDGIIADSAFLPALYELGDDDDWRDEKTWRKANPNIGVSVDAGALRRAVEKAKADPAYENSVRRLHFNQRTEQDLRVVPMEAWDQCFETFTAADLRGQRCFAGLDLASTDDLCSLGLVFPAPDGTDCCRVLSYSWCPAERVAVRTQKRIPYHTWQREGWLTATTGNVTDYGVIREDICRLRDAMGLQIVEISFDAWGAAQLVQDLQDRDGFTLVRTPQSLMQLSAPTKEYLRRIKSGRIRHNGNPLLRWANSNMAVHYQGRLQAAADTEDILDKVPIMPSKQNSSDKIDPAVAVILAFKSMIAHPEEYGVSRYESAGLVTI